MFEAVELGQKLSKEEFHRQLPALRAKLLESQRALVAARVPVVIVVGGVEGAGKGEVVNRLNEWLDPRGLDIHAFWHAAPEEEAHPAFWRFWRALPARGRVAIMFGSWYSTPIVRRVYGEIKNAEFKAALDRIAFLERMLAADGTLIVKLWYHLTKRDQRQRLKALESHKDTRVRVQPSDWEHHELYGKFRRFCERALRHTDAAHAPWQLIEATDARHRDLATVQTLVTAFTRRLAQPASALPPAAAAGGGAAPGVPKRARTILSRVNLSQRLAKDEYEEKLLKYQGRLGRLMWEMHRAQRSAVVVFEGWDAAGKGGAIRRIVAAVDARLCRVVPIAAPTDEERAHHYLWRFWRHIPGPGRLIVFDRSWYGRLLVERVEGFARPDEWRRAYLEINDFEDQLAGHGLGLAKFWLHIGKAEQLRRFRERERIPYKQYKITPDDWRNRRHWGAYEAAVNEMVARTSTEVAPWTLVAGNQKKFARVQVLRTLCERLEATLD